MPAGPRYLNVDPTDAVPIWKQIEDGIRQRVAASAFAADEAVPSVRDLARELRVNPNTVAKAYQHLTELGVLRVHRGEGTFVANATPAQRRAERQGLLQAAAVRFAELAASIGATELESLDAIRTALSETKASRQEQDYEPVG